MSHLKFMERLRIPTYDDGSCAATGRVAIDTEKCTGCGVCVSTCPGKALFITGSGKNKKSVMDDRFPQCMACNDCAAMCSKGAIRVSRGYDFGRYYKALARGDQKPPRPFD